MIQHTPGIRRRHFLQWLAGAGAALAVRPGAGAIARSDAIRKPIPSSGEQLPVIGMGSWLTFDVGADERERASRVPVLQAFFDHGGALIDSSPMTV